MNSYETTKRGDLLFKLILVAAALLFVYSIGSSNNSTSVASNDQSSESQVLGDAHIVDLLEKKEAEERKAVEAAEKAAVEAAEAEESISKPVTEQNSSSNTANNTDEEPVVQPQIIEPIVTVSEETNPETGVITRTIVTNDNGVIATVIEIITPGSTTIVSDGLSISQ